MDKPAPSTTSKERMEIKEREIREESRKFRKSVSEKIGQFVKDDRPYIEFEAVDCNQYMAVYDIAASAGLVSLLFGGQSVVYKNKHYPSADEMEARMNGEGWNEKIAQKYAEKRKLLVAQKQTSKAAEPEPEPEPAAKKPKTAGIKRKAKAIENPPDAKNK
ncbi:uncharacterized protein LOC117588461 [Drosophila guanche]|uniref:Uncharacterized protein n=1 Tax=Drosophila guanche TaxID=7266 RepID=A0A3B0KN61_DROGU|nr:uncharacterized protein LOC117588461 [Drosophila guanche]XP_034135641.1 uncharacterized protein LOC117588461 [Drosophila guanche]SPP86581.1 Hypothetical predicted protein [Drosophila guanche]